MKRIINEIDRYPGETQDILKAINEYSETKERISKDEYYLGIAEAIAKRSTCLRRQYGCVIVNNDEIIATGYNGSARNELNCCEIYFECPRKNKEHNSGDYSDCPAVHAEQNAMLSASRQEMIGSTMYLYGQEISDEQITESSPYKEKQAIKINAEPCPICKRMIKNAGISKIINIKGVTNVCN
jgi:dCMP deaminase